MKYKCIICENENCLNILSSNNESLARYGFLKSEDSAPVATGLDQELAYCNDCSFAWNTVFEYSKVKYDSDKIIEAGFFSKRYLDYQKATALYLKKLIGFKSDTIVEIGAGAGIFINEFDAKRKVAIEPSSEANQIQKSIEVYNEYYSEEKFNFAADIVVIRQVLEHIKDPVSFLNSIKKSFCKNDKFYIYIEVPNSGLTFRFGRFYDFYYEHCNYFTSKSLNELANQLGMVVVDLSTGMDGELISVLLTNEKINSTTIKDSIDKNRVSVSEKLKSKFLQGKKVVAWGASGNGVQMLNILNIDKSKIPYIIDSDKNKQGKYIPVTLQKIISPELAVEFNPDVVLVLTQFHKAEIGTACSKLFPNAEILFVD